jgi:hypothetical protein
MRRLLSLLLFAATLLPLLAPMLAVAADAQAGVPACCRRGGAHHCMGGMAMESDGAPQVRGPREICPYQQRAVTPVHHEQVGMSSVGGRMVVVLRGAQVG